METCIQTQQPFVIDNTNPTREDRAKYIAVAKANKFKLICYYFQSRIDESFTRNRQRTGKEYIPEIGIKGTFNRMQLPDFNEGFDEIYYVEIDNNGFNIKEWENEI